MGLITEIKEVDEKLAEAIENYGEKEFVEAYNRIAIVDEESADNFILLLENFTVKEEFLTINGII